VKDHAFVGRQAILDRQLGLYAYELLFRSAGGAGADAVGGNRATGEVLLATFAELGLQRVVGRARAFVNFTRDLLLEGGDRLPLPPSRVVIEVLEDVVVDDALVRAIRSLSRQGYTIALDDFEFDERWRPILPFADIVKLDVRALDPQGIEDHVQLLRPYGCRLLAEKVETRNEYERLCELGFELFQGFFFSKPEIVSGKRLQANRLQTLEVLRALQDPEQSLDGIEEIVRQDVAISYKLLRFMNSAMFAFSDEITSIRRAVVHLGMENLRKIASLIALTRLENKPQELMRMALVRARMCELLSGERSADEAATFFTVGLFSALDALLDAPLEELLDELPVSGEIREALLDQAGNAGKALHCVLAYERCDFAEVEFGGASANELAGLYADAVEWSFDVSDGITNSATP
jgi:EAL and modified HD-GYP domain-containing signal transduction protein